MTRIAIRFVMLLLLISFIIVLTIYSMDNRSYEYTENQNLTNKQKSQAIELALKDKNVSYEIGNKNYTITEVRVAGIGTEMINSHAITKYYPMVRIALGDDPDYGQDLAVYVDLYNNTVVGITHPYRGPVIYR